MCEPKGARDTNLTVDATIDVVANGRIDGSRRRRTAGVPMSDKMKRGGNKACGATRYSRMFPRPESRLIELAVQLTQREK